MFFKVSTEMLVINKFDVILLIGYYGILTHVIDSKVGGFENVVNCVYSLWLFCNLFKRAVLSMPLGKLRYYNIFVF